MRKLTTINGGFNINNEIYDQDYTNTITLELPSTEWIYTHREIKGRHYLFTSVGIYELKEQVDTFAKINDQIFIGCRPVVDSDAIYIIGWRETKDGAGEFVAYNLSSKTTVGDAIVITASDLTSMKQFIQNQPRQDWYASQSNIGDKRYIFPCSETKCFMVIFYKDNSNIVFRLHTINFNTPITSMVMAGREDFVIRFNSTLENSTLENTRYYLFNKGELKADTTIKTTDGKSGFSTHTFYDTVTVNSDIGVSNVEYIGGGAISTADGIPVGVAIVKATVDNSNNQVCLMYRSNWARTDNGRYLIIDNTATFGTLEQLDCGSMWVVTNNVDEPEIVLANANTIYHVKIKLAHIYNLMHNYVGTDRTIILTEIKKEWISHEIIREFTFPTNINPGKRELFTVDVVLKQLILKCENAIMYYDYSTQKDPNIEKCSPIAVNRDTFIRAGRGFCSYANIHMRIGRGGIVINGALINPTVQAIRSTIAELMARISALENAAAE